MLDQQMQAEGPKSICPRVDDWLASVLASQPWPVPAVKPPQHETDGRSVAEEGVYSQAGR